jgi:hypothetical protein
LIRRTVTSCEFGHSPFLTVKNHPYSLVLGLLLRELKYQRLHLLIVCAHINNDELRRVPIARDVVVTIRYLRIHRDEEG